MKIIVCVKQVPDTETRVKIAASGAGIEEEGINWVVSPYDEFAVEEALRIKEKSGGEVVLVSLGPDRVQAALRNGLAMGADAGVHLKDPLFDAADTLGTARALAAAIEGIGGFDLVLTGQQGVGGDHGQIPGLLAELLDLPQVTMAVKVEIQGAKAIVEREIEGAREIWETSLPAVLSAQKGLNEPRYANLKGIMAAKKKPIDVKDAAGLGLDVAALAPRTKVVAMELPPARPPVKMVQGDPEAQAKELLRLLHEEAKVI
ncbi:MAG TPA: electron transfer flavoprotein subunit beta/FixA family protein [Vicinamibacteria bacterium]|nr:electron transfer flavoprotein subunit beta/FixA family protein [Vicinamibacteria bacterium]